MGNIVCVVHIHSPFIKIDYLAIVHLFRKCFIWNEKEVATAVTTSTLNYSLLPALTAFAITSLGLLPLTL